MNNSSEAVLQCRDLCKRYHDGAAVIEVLKSVNFTVLPSQLIAIVGNSGSGKSTLLHLLAGLDKPTEGTVLLQGRDLAKLSENERSTLRNQQLGFIYQFHHLLPEFTALENVCMPLLLSKTTVPQATSRAKELLVLVGLEQRMSHKIGELSGGERQRVAIARALVTHPACVLADEPTGNLDPSNAERVLQLFLDLQSQLRTSVIMVTHDVKIAGQAQYRYSIDHGTLVQSDV